MSTVIHKFFPEPNLSDAAPATSPSATQKDNKKVIAAITAAIIHHREG
jgi:oxaloacetate decarboxylase gamma subunit